MISKRNTIKTYPQTLEKMKPNLTSPAVFFQMRMFFSMSKVLNVLIGLGLASASGTKLFQHVSQGFFLVSYFIDNKQKFAGWWFQIFFMFIPIWGNDRILLIFFIWVENG